MNKLLVNNGIAIVRRTIKYLRVSKSSLLKLVDIALIALQRLKTRRNNIEVDHNRSIENITITIFTQHKVRVTSDDNSVLMLFNSSTCCNISAFSFTKRMIDIWMPSC